MPKRLLGVLGEVRLEILEGDARHFSRIIKQADVVVSGLPLVSFSDKDHEAVLSEIKKMAKLYVQLHYSPLGEGQMKEHFGKFERKIVLGNVPPAIVYTVKL